MSRELTPREMEIQRMEAAHSLEDIKTMAVRQNLSVEGTKREIIGRVIDARERKPGDPPLWKTFGEAHDDLQRLTVREMTEVARSIRDPSLYPYFEGSDTKEQRIHRIVRWYDRSPHKDKVRIVEAFKARIQEKKGYPIAMLPGRK